MCAGATLQVQAGASLHINMSIASGGIDQSSVWGARVDYHASTSGVYLASSSALYIDPTVSLLC